MSEPYEFDCAACKRHIINVAGEKHMLCATCTHSPGWYLNPTLRKVFEPDEDYQVPTVSPEQFLNFVIHIPGRGYVAVGEVTTLGMLQLAHQNAGELGMWRLVLGAVLE